MSNFMVYSSLVSSSKLELICLDNTLNTIQYNTIVIYEEAYVCLGFQNFYLKIPWLCLSH